MIAARALVREAAAVTGNVSDYAPAGVHVIDPFRTSATAARPR